MDVSGQTSIRLDWFAVLRPDDESSSAQTFVDQSDVRIVKPFKAQLFKLLHLAIQA